MPYSYQQTPSYFNCLHNLPRDWCQLWYLWNSSPSIHGQLGAKRWRGYWTNVANTCGYNADIFFRVMRDQVLLIRHEKCSMNTRVKTGSSDSRFCAYGLSEMIAIFLVKLTQNAWMWVNLTNKSAFIFGHDKDSICELTRHSFFSLNADWTLLKCKNERIFICSCLDTLIHLMCFYVYIHIPLSLFPKKVFALIANKHQEWNTIINILVLFQ